MGDRRRQAVVAAAGLALALAAACRGGEHEAERTITVWAMGEEGKQIRRLADRFEKQNPGVKVKTQSIPWSAAEAKLMTAFVGEIAPDLVQLGTTYLPKFAAMGALQPLDVLVERSRVIDREDYYAGPLDGASYEGRLYGVPWYIDTWVLYYRTDLLRQAGFDHPPRTWAELKQVGRELAIDRDGDGRNERYGIGISPTDARMLSVLVAQAGGHVLREGQIGVQRPAFREALSFFVSLFDEKIAPRAMTRDTDVYQAFEDGHYPMLVGGPWMLARIQRQCPQLRGRWSVAPLPRHRRRSSFVGGSVLAIPRVSRRKALAWRFVEYLGRPSTQLSWYRISTTLPPTRAAWKSDLLRRDPMVAVFGAQLETAQAPPSIPEWEEISDKIGRDYLEKLVHHLERPQVALARLQAEIAAILDKSRRRSGHQSTAFKIGMLALVGGVLIALLVVFLSRRSRDPGPGGGLDVRDVRGSMHVPYLFLLPALAVLAVFVFLPILASFLMSLTDWNIYAIEDWKRISFAGLANYRALLWEVHEQELAAVSSIWGYLAFWNYLGDPVFWRSLANTFVFVAVGVPLSIVVSLAAALALNQAFVRAKSLFRVGFFMPVVTTMVAVAVVWRWLYNPRFGLINHFLQSAGVQGQDWLNDPLLALPALIVMAVWKNFGYNMIIFLAGLQGIPRTYYEAAQIDGATTWQRFRHVTLPLLAPTMYFVSLMTVIGYFQFFAEPYVMTGGGPLNSTMSIVLYMYNHGFKFYNLGYATAIAFVLFVFISLFTVGQRRLSRRLVRP